MLTLAIETATKKLGVSLMDGSKLLGMHECLFSGNPHGESLAPFVEQLLLDARVSASDLDLVVVDQGPGSFTGLRIGLGFAKSLAFSLKTPVVGVSSLDVLAAAVPDSDKLICPVIDAKRGNLYTAVYVWGKSPSSQEGDFKMGDCPQKRTEYLLCPPNELLSQLDQKAVFIGDGADIFADQLSAAGTVLTEDFWWPSSVTLNRLGQAQFKAQGAADPQTLSPIYLYPMDCTVRKS